MGKYHRYNIGEVIMRYDLINKKKNNVWDNVWDKDVYSKPDLRREKAIEKVDRLINHIMIDKSTVVLDLGCGGGYVSRELYNRTGAKIYGIDNSEKAICLAIKKSEGMPISYKKQDVRNLPFKENFADVILCIGIIEHIKNHNQCIDEVRRVLKNNGLVYVVSSNRDSFIYEQKVIREKLGCWNYGYQKNWEKDALEKLFLGQDFLTEYIEIGKGIGNFKIIDKMDRLFSTTEKKRGRYIYYIGRLKK